MKYEGGDQIALLEKTTFKKLSLIGVKQMVCNNNYENTIIEICNNFHVDIKKWS